MHIKGRYLEHFLCKCPEANATRPHWWLVIIGSSNGLVLFGENELFYYGTTLHYIFIIQYVYSYLGYHKFCRYFIDETPTMCWTNTNTLILGVLKTAYSGRTRSIPWLLMPWLCTSPGHQWPWYSICGINGSLSSMKKNFKHLSLFGVENL